MPGAVHPRGSKCPWQCRGRERLAERCTHPASPAASQLLGDLRENICLGCQVKSSSLMSGHWKSSQGKGEGGERGKEPREGGREKASKQSRRAGSEPQLLLALPVQEAAAPGADVDRAITRDLVTRLSGLPDRVRDARLLEPGLWERPFALLQAGGTRWNCKPEKGKFSAGRGKGRVAAPIRFPPGRVGGPGPQSWRAPVR